MNLDEAGIIWVSPRTCRPLEDVRVEYLWNGLDGQDVAFAVSDAAHKVYCERTVKAGRGKVELTITTGGKAGTHHITAQTTTPDGKPWIRHGGFRMLADTSIVSDSADLNDLFEQIEQALLQAVDITLIDAKPVTHYKHADNTRENIAYPVWPMNAYRYFLSDMKSVHEAHFAYQYPNGSLPDHIYSDNYHCPATTRRLRSCMADLEIAAASTVCHSWEAHGDDAWMAQMLPKVEASLEYVLSDPSAFDVEHGVIKRPHTLDYWDIHFTEEGEQGCFINEKTKYVIMQGDTSSLYHTACCLADVYDALGNEDRSNRWRMVSRHIRKIGNDLFWDGGKYRHHIHLDPFDHGDFNEDEQLTMSNAFAVTRGFADHEQAVTIINEYMRRLETTGDRFPWWSLQPGYPDELDYFSKEISWRKLQGEYCNGGLFPWVGGELCRAAFQHGKEQLARELLADVHYVLKRDNGAMFTWYDLQGNAAMNAPHNQTNQDPFGLHAWAQAMIEDLAGIQSLGKCFEQVACSPRWPATECHEVSATSRFPASDTYFAYRYQLSESQITMTFAGTGKHVAFRILLPPDRTCREVLIDGQQVTFTHETVETSTYVVFDAAIAGARELTCSF